MIRGLMPIALRKKLRRMAPRGSRIVLDDKLAAGLRNILGSERVPYPAERVLDGLFQRQGTKDPGL